MYELSTQQKHALGLWKELNNVRVIAVAGAGKSTLILEMCKHTEGPVCIITYNKPLQKELDEKLKASESQSVAYTFHGLASEYYKVCQDDTTLASIVASINSKKEFLYDKIIIDESQDMKQVYFDLISKLMNIQNVQIALLGDPEQMLYDYDLDDPAVLSFLNQPDESFGVSFSKATLSVSFRLTPCIASLSNALAPTDSVKIEPGNLSHSNEKVDLQICNRFLWSDVARDWILKHHPITKKGTIHILAATRKRNGEMKRLVNQLATYGYSIYVHIDDPITNKQHCKVHVMSWHSSKGSESDTTVILGVGGNAALNPLHVALTRSRHNMLILADKDNIFLPLAKLVTETPPYINIIDKERSVEAAQSALDSAKIKEEKESNKEPTEKDDEIDKRERTPNLNPQKRIESDKTYWEPLGREYRLANYIHKLSEEMLISPQYVPDDEEPIGGNFVANTTSHYLEYAKIRNEFKHTRNVRMHYFVTHPLPGKKRKRAELESIHELPRSGTHEFDLLPSFAMKELKRQFSDLNSLSSITEWMTLAVLLNSWNGFHNKTQLHLPVDAWINEDAAIDAERLLHSAIPPSITDYNGYATYTRSPKLSYKAKYFAKGNGIVYQCIFEETISYQLKSRLALPAIFLGHKLKIINLKNGQVSFYEFPREIDKTLEAFNL